MPISKQSTSPEELQAEGLILEARISEPEDEPVEQDSAYDMLVDTGATISALDSDLADDIGLPIVGFQETFTAGGPVRAGVRLGKILFGPQYPFRRQVIRLLELDFGGQEGIDGLIGRDLLQLGMLTWVGFTGECIISD